MNVVKKLYRKLTRRRYFNKDHSPRRCVRCGCQQINSRVISVDGGTASEISYYCFLCDRRLGYYAYGSFDPCFIMGYLGVSE